MPYIPKKDRSRVVNNLNYEANTAGELNYLLTDICAEYLSDKGESYATYNEIIGVLECCKLEFYRRKVSKYEDKKLKQNGDVY